MTILKSIGLVAAGLSIAALIGGGAWWLYRRRKQRDAGEPQTPERPKRADPTPEPVDRSPRGVFLDRSSLPPELAKALDEHFPDAWPPDDETVNAMVAGEVIVIAAESEPVGSYDHTRQELLKAKVLSVEKTLIRARITGEVAHAEHHGSHAGHGFRLGDLIEVPRSKILVAARPNGPVGEGYGSEGRPARTFKPSNVTKQVYKVRPDTPYDLVLPYRTDELEWHVDREMVKMVKVGDKSLLEQIKFGEDSMRGCVSVRLLDRDPKEGLVFVARWDFDIAA